MKLTLKKIADFSRGLGMIREDSGYRFFFLDKNGIMIKELCDEVGWEYEINVEEAVEFAKYLAKKRGWILKGVEQIYLKDLSSKYKKERPTVGDLSIFSGTIFEW